MYQLFFSLYNKNLKNVQLNILKKKLIIFILRFFLNVKQKICFTSSRLLKKNFNACLRLVLSD